MATQEEKQQRQREARALLAGGVQFCRPEIAESWSV